MKINRIKKIFSQAYDYFQAPFEKTREIKDKISEKKLRRCELFNFP